MIGDKLSMTETMMLQFVTAHPGEVERRTDYEGNTYWYAEAGRVPYHDSTALSTLLEHKLIEVRTEPRRTVGLREPRIARTVYAT